MADEERNKRWEKREALEETMGESRMRTMLLEEKRAQLSVEVITVDLEYAKARLKSMTAQETYWRVLEEVQLMRKALEKD